MDHIEIRRLDGDIEVTELDAAEWQIALPVAISTYWSGLEAPGSRHFEARLLWSETALYVRFDAEQHEPLIVGPQPETSQKVIGLWERDVCEIFIAPDATARYRYFEFEVAPTGEWLDLSIEITAGGRNTIWDYNSGMTAAARVEAARVLEIIKIPFDAFGTYAKAGDVWHGNLFRCVGTGPGRGYLAWRPTRTEVPAFHVPEVFGEMRFVD